MRQASGDDRRAVHSLCGGSGMCAGNESGYHLKRQSADLETQRWKEDGAPDETETLRKGLRQVLERRHRQFGFYEALLVGSGTMLVALGCVLYLVGVLIESH
jgi:hypothetical protein